MLAQDALLPTEGATGYSLRKLLVLQLLLQEMLKVPAYTELQRQDLETVAAVAWGFQNCLMFESRFA